jgi:hypothetical protein
MAVFTIQTPSGRTLDIEAGDEAAAIRGAQEWETNNTATVDTSQKSEGAIANALKPFTSYPSTYSEMNREAREQVGRGVEQLSEGEGWLDTAKGVGNVGLGALGYVTSPVNAALRTFVGQPVEDVTGIPKEYPEFAASLAIPGASSKTAQALAQRAANKARTAAPTVSELKSASTPIYEDLTTTGNQVVLPQGIGAQMADDIGVVLHPQAMRPASSPRTYNQLSDLKKAADLNDVAIVRDHLRDTANGIAENKLIRVTGKDSNAARQSMQMLDRQMEQLSPGWTAKMAEADSNWAAAKRIQTVEKEAKKGQKGRLGSFDSNELRAKGYTKEEIDAIKRAHTGGAAGTVLNAVGTVLNPAHGGLGPLAMAMTHVPAAAATGGTSLLASAAGVPVGMAADAAAAFLRQRAFNQAVSKLGERSALAKQRRITAPPQPLIGPLTTNLLGPGTSSALIGTNPDFQLQDLLR